MLSTLITIWLLHVAALLTPGPNTLLVSHVAASADRRSASYAAAGIATGAAIWSSAAVLGVSALFTAFPAARLSLQIAGALYLIYIGLRLWRSHAPEAGNAASLVAFRAFRAGLLTNLSNPKSALFFGSVFSAALPAHPDVWLPVAAVGLVFFNALCWHLLLAFVFSCKAVQTGYAAQRGVVSRVAGAVVGGLGLSLLLASLREARG